MRNANIRRYVRGQLSLLAGACLGLSVASMPAQAIVSSTDPSNWLGGNIDYLGGVGLLTVARSDGNFGCSGSLLAGGQYVLTAAHCLSGDTGAATTSSVSMSFLGGSVTASSSTYYLNGYAGDSNAGNDIALIKLSTAITQIDGYQLGLLDQQGSTVVLAGYGFTGTGSSGYNSGTFGTLHYGFNQYDASNLFYSQNAYSSGVYLYDFDNPAGGGNLFGSNGTGTSEALIAPGDSGGATLVNVNGEWQIAGVHSFLSCFATGCPADSRFGDYAGDVSVAGQSTWLLSYVGAVPEPESRLMLLAGLGLVGLIAGRRYRRAGI